VLGAASMTCTDDEAKMESDVETRPKRKGGPWPRSEGHASALDGRGAHRCWAAACQECTDVHTLYPLAQWDPETAAANLRKHGVDFADAETVLHDERALTVADDDPEEDRFVTVGMDALGRVLVVVYEWRDDDWRLISARKASRSERRQYEGRR
jgi:uncharacterized protein